MNSRHIAMASVLVGVLACAQNAAAQGYSRGRSDNPNGATVSPYLNLLNNNNIGLPSYQTLVKPLVDQQNAIQRQGNSINSLQQQVNSGGRGTGTGHASYFMNYSHYYTRNGRR